MGFLKKEKRTAVSVQTQGGYPPVLPVTAGERALYRALREQVPEITKIEVVPNDPTPEVMPLVSLQRSGRDAGWIAGPSLESLPEGTPVRMELADGKSLVIIRLDAHVQAFRNECAHLGLPIDGGTIDREARTITCPWHGFRFDCLSGECLTAPQAQLEPVPLRVEHGIVHVRPS